jgi:hypothetical protein
MVRFAVLEPPAASCTEPFDGVTVISEELACATHDVVSANVVEVSVMLTGPDPPLVSETELTDGVIVYAGAVTVSVAVPLEVPYDEPSVGV